MDVVDGQIIATLLHLDPDIFDNFHEIPKTVTELDVETFYQAIVLLLWACKPNIKKEIPSKLLPQNMAAKFRCAARVIDAVKNIGVRDPIDYQTLLYGRSKELRCVLIGLIEKLPKDSPVVTFTKDPFTELFQSAIRAEEEKTNSSCYNPFLEKLWTSPRRVNFLGFGGDVLSALQYEDSRDGRKAIICSLLENNAIRESRMTDDHFLRSEMFSAFQNRHPVISKSMKPQLKPKPAFLSKPQALLPLKLEERTSEEDIEKSKALEKLVTEVMVLKTSVACKKTSRAKMRSDESGRVLALKNGEKLLQSKFDGRLEKLLKDSNAVVKLENYINGSGERMKRLQNLWLNAKSKKDEVLKQARMGASVTDCSSMEYNCEDLLEDVKMLESELAAKKIALDKIKKQVSSIEKQPINRSIYTKHIFDIVGNIRKQQDEINKTAVENVQLQKEIKSIAGKLERSFDAVEEKVYKDVENDPCIQKAYKLLIKIHSKCSCVITGIDSSGQLEWEIEELSDQIAIQQQKKIDKKLENIVNAWLEIRSENMALKEMLTKSNN